MRQRVSLRGELSSDKIDVIYNGLDLSSYSQATTGRSIRAELAIGEDNPLVGMVANFNFEIKGHRYFLEAARLLLQARPHVNFVLVGDGPLRGKYEGMARSIGIEEKVHFLGKRTNVPAILAGLSVSVLSSTSEGLSNVLLESMAAGKPIVATRVGGNSEIVVDGVIGYLVPPADPQDMAAALLMLLKSPDIGTKMGAAGRSRVEKDFSVEAMVRSHMSVLNANGWDPL